MKAKKLNHYPKMALCTTLDHACSLVDRLPNWTYRFVGHYIGCPAGMGMWMFDLVDHWELQYWYYCDVTEDGHCINQLHDTQKCWERHCEREFDDAE